ncbi:MAG: hypothetical protein U1E42_09370 [Rhodospirillales bacterium]
MALDIAEAAGLLLAPLPGHFVEEVAADLAVEFVDVHGIDTGLQAIVFRAEALDRLLVLAVLVGVAGVQRLAHPFQRLVIQAQLTEHRGELMLQHLLADIRAAAGRWLAPTLIGITGAVVVDVLLLFDLAYHRAAALGAGDQSREGEIVFHAPMLARVAAVQHALHPFPQFDRDQRLVLTLVELTVPLEPAGVEAVSQDRL